MKAIHHLLGFICGCLCVALLVDAIWQCAELLWGMFTNTPTGGTYEGVVSLALATLLVPLVLWLGDDAKEAAQVGNGVILDHNSTFNPTRKGRGHAGIVEKE